MKQIAATSLQILVALLGIGVLAALLWEPHLEGVNANATGLYQIYFDDPFLAYIYFSFIAVFVGLYQAFKLLGYIGRNKTFSQESVQALRSIKYCAITFVAFIVGAEAMIMAHRGEDDIAGGVAMGLMLILASLAIATIAGIFEKRVRKNLTI
jgi:hypothetical protein